MICGPDALYTEHAATIATAMKAAGAAVVHLAGRGREIEAGLRAAGVDNFIFMGCDVAAVLGELHKQLEAA